MGRRKSKSKSAAMWILVAVILSIIITVVTGMILPAVFGVSLSGIFTAIRNKLGLVGGGIGAVVGYMVEFFSSFSRVIIEPLMAGNIFAIMGMSGFLTLVAVMLINIFQADQVWR